MKATKKHIVTLLLAIFWIPQVNNSIHYFVVHHHYNNSYSDKTEVHKLSNDHICKQHIFVQAALLVPELINYTCIRTDFNIKKDFLFIQKKYFKTLFNFYTRGPPQQLLAQKSSI